MNNTDTNRNAFKASSLALLGRNPVNEGQPSTVGDRSNRLRRDLARLLDLASMGMSTSPITFAMIQLGRWIGHPHVLLKKM